jgi:hypothetical protein
MFPEHTRHLAFLAAAVLLALGTAATFGREQIAHAQWAGALGQALPGRSEAATPAERSETGSALAEAVPSVPTGGLAPAGSSLQTSSLSGPTGSDPQAQPTTSFRICRPPDPQIAPAIEQLIAGRSFSMVLTAGADDCAELQIAVQPGGLASGRQVNSSSRGSTAVSIVQSSGLASGRQVSNVSVGLGGNRRISVQIVSENGSTSVTIGAA